MGTRVNSVIRETAGVSDYWSRVLAPIAVEDIAEKYRSLIAVVDHDEAQQGPILRAAAARWPGSLREARSTMPTIYRRRGDAAEFARTRTAMRRGGWRERGLVAVALWWDLHGLIGDLQAWRQTEPDQRSRVAFLDHLARGEPSVLRRTALPWPEPDGAEAAAVFAEERPSVRAAHRWLGHVAGLSPDELRAGLRA